MRTLGSERVPFLIPPWMRAELLPVAAGNRMTSVLSPVVAGSSHVAFCTAWPPSCLLSGREGEGSGRPLCWHGGGVACHWAVTVLTEVGS